MSGLEGVPWMGGGRVGEKGQAKQRAYKDTAAWYVWERMHFSM